MGKLIFISYRRDDASGASGRLYDWLRIAFGREQVFRDVTRIGPGKWRDKINAALADSAVSLPVIGPRWCDATNGPRLADKNDMVRHEIRYDAQPFCKRVNHHPYTSRRR